MFSKLTKFISILVFVGICAMLPTSVYATSIIYEGSSTIGENVLVEAARLLYMKEGIRFGQINMAGSGAGFKAAMEGKAHIGGLSRALTEKEKAVEPYVQVIGYDGIAIFVNGNNPVRNLTREQIKGIFTGRIRNWKAVGGEDSPIEVVTELQDSDRATIKVFKKLALDGDGFGPSKEIDKPHACVRYVAMNEGAITHASLAFAEPRVKGVAVDGVVPSTESVQGGSYPLTRPLILVTKDTPEGAVKKFFDLILSPEGQEIVGRSFVPAR